MADSVEIEEFARAYFEGDRPPYIPGGDLRKNDHGYYLRLDFGGIETADLESLVAKARDTYDRVEVVERVIEGGDITKERRYVESENEVPDGYMAERGPKGGIYYETQPQTGSPGGSGGPGDVATGVGYSGEPVLAVQFEDVDEGDRIAFEKPESGERDMGEVTSIDEDENTVTVTSGDGETDVLAAPLEGIEKEGDGGGTMTSSTTGAHNAVYSPDEDEEDDLGQAGEVSKEEAFEADVFRVLFPEDMEEAEGDLAGIGVDFPNHDVYVDWRNSAFEDELDNPHVSVYGSIDDLEQATGNIVEPIGTVDGNDDSLAKMAVEVASKVSLLSKNSEETWVFYMGPDGGEGWQNVQTGEVRYQAARPGEAPEDAMVEGDFASGWAEPPEDFSELIPGQQVEVEAEGEYYDAEVSYFDDSGVPRLKAEEWDNDFTPSNYATITAVEEDPEVPAEVLDHEVGEEVELETDAFPEDHPDYVHEEGVITDYQVHNGELYYEVSDPDDGPVINEYTEDELEDLIVEPGWEEMMEDETGETVHNPDPGDPVTIEWEGDTENGPFEAEYDPQDEPGGEEPTPGYTVTDQMYDGMWVNMDEAEIVDEGSDGETSDSEDVVDDALGESSEPSGEILDAAGVEVGDEFEYEGKPAKVVGETSMMQDGEPSHVEVDLGETTLPVHPNSIPDGVGDELPEPSADEEAEDLLDEFDGYDPDNAEEFRDMSDIGASHGNSVSAMEVAVMPDGSKYVHKDTSHPTVDPGDIDREMAGYEAAKHLDDNIPEHSAGDGWAASEVAPGVDAKDATPEMRDAVDKNDFYDMAATQLLIGNTDLHQNNLRVDEDGELYPFDLDRAAGDLQGDWVGNLTQYDDTMDRAIGEMDKAAVALGVHMDEDVLLSHAKDKAIELTNDVDTLEDIVSDARGVNDQMGEVIQQNIEAFYQGELTP